MANTYGADGAALQALSGALQAETGDTLLSTESSGERATVFGAIATREIQTGIANGAFDSRPPLPGSNLDESENPLPFWTVTDSSSGAITGKAALEADNPSGYAIEVTVPNATATGQSWSLSKFFPLSGNSAETLALDPIVYLDAALVSGTANTEVRLDLSFADADYVATGGTASGTITYASLITAGIAPADKSVSTATTIAPSAAAFGKLTVTVTTTGTVNATGPLIVTVREAIVRRGFSLLPISDNVGTSSGTYPAGSLSLSSGSMVLTSGQRTLDATGNVILSAVSSGTSVATFDVTSAAGTGLYRSASATLTGVGVNPILTLSSTSSSGDVNLYRTSADRWKTDDSFDIAGSLLVGGSATITGNLTAGGISFTNLSVSGTAYVAGSATFGSAVTVSGNTSLSNVSASGTSYVAGSATFGSAVTVTGTTSLSNVSASGTAYVAGSATFNSAVTATGPLTVGGTIIYGLPPGSITPYLGAATAVPTGWILANGASLSTATYPALFAAIGYNFGGSGANFSVPNLNAGYLLLGYNGTPSSTFMTGASDAWLNTTWNHTHSTNPAAFNSATSATAQVVQSGSGAGPSALSHVHSIDVPATTSSDAGPSDVYRIRVVFLIKT